MRTEMDVLTDIRGELTYVLNGFEQPLQFQEPLSIGFDESWYGMEVPERADMEMGIENFLLDGTGSEQVYLYLDEGTLNYTEGHADFYEEDSIDLELLYLPEYPHKEPDVIWNHGDTIPQINEEVSETSEEDQCCRSDCTNPALEEVSSCEEHSDLKESDSEEEDDDNDTETTITFEEEMAEIAEDMENRDLRERRDIFKAEILEVGPSPRGKRGSKVRLKCDIDTEPSEKKFHFKKPPDGKRFLDILNHLGADLRKVKEIEGMSIPVTYTDGDWEVKLPSDSTPLREKIPLSKVPLPSRSTLSSLTGASLVVWFFFGIIPIVDTTRGMGFNGTEVFVFTVIIWLGVLGTLVKIIEWLDQ